MATTNVEVLKSVANTSNVWKDIAWAGNGGLPEGTPFHITGYDARDMMRVIYNGETGQQVGEETKVNKKFLLVMTTDINVDIFVSTINRVYRDAVDRTKIIRCGGAVYDAWRNVNGQGLTNEGYLKKLLEVTADSNGNQRPLKASYEYLRVLDRDGKEYDRRILSIDFAD